jgi:hypothetical protein
MDAVVILVAGVSEHEAPGLRYKRWSHMVSTTSEADLYEFAAGLGLKRSWAQLRPEHTAPRTTTSCRRRAPWRLSSVLAVLLPCAPEQSLGHLR